MFIDFSYFETDRLVVRQYTLSDLVGLSIIMSNPQVHVYTKDKNNPWNEKRTENYIRFMIDKNFKTLDCFHGAVIEKSSKKIIGLTGLNPYKDKEPEIEWKLGASYWGKGYATELGEKIIKEAFSTTDIIGIYGMTHPDNIASQKVLRKIGMNYLGIRKFRDQDDAFYYIGRL